MTHTYQGTKPMKMKTVEKTKLSEEVLTDSNEWLMQQKMDGTRAFIKIRFDELQDVWAFEWLSSSGTPLKFAAATQHLAAIEDDLMLNGHLEDEEPDHFRVTEAIIDAELILEDGTLHIFDLPWLRMAVNGMERLVVTPDTPVEERLAAISVSLRAHRDHPRIKALPIYSSAQQKRERLEEFKLKGVEGAIFKKVGTPYVPNPKVRTTDQLKLKFVKEADVVVLERNVKGKENAVLGVHIDGELTEIGNCTMIGKADAQPGDVIEVQYLYWTGSAMIQPRMARIRKDKEPHECAADQFPLYSREVV